MHSHLTPHSGLTAGTYFLCLPCLQGHQGILPTIDGLVHEAQAWSPQHSIRSFTSQKARPSPTRTSRALAPAITATPLPAAATATAISPPVPAWAAEGAARPGPPSGRSVSPDMEKSILAHGAGFYQPGSESYGATHLKLAVPPDCPAHIAEVIKKKLGKYMD